MKTNQGKAEEPTNSKPANEEKKLSPDTMRLLERLKESQRIIRENPLPGKRRS
jgi:hypothetical protein